MIVAFRSAKVRFANALLRSKRRQWWTSEALRSLGSAKPEREPRSATKTKRVAGCGPISLGGMVNIPRVKLGGISPTLGDGAFLGCGASLVACHCSGAIRHSDPTLPELV